MNRRGFTMIELMIALAIFAFAVISLMGALKAGIDAAVAFRKERQLQVLLADRLEEIRIAPLTPGRFENDSTLFPGRIHTEVEPVELLNHEGAPLSGMFRVTVRYEPSGRDAPAPLAVETFIHQMQ